MFGEDTLTMDRKIRLMEMAISVTGRNAGKRYHIDAYHEIVDAIGEPKKERFAEVKMTGVEKVKLLQFLKWAGLDLVTDYTPLSRLIATYSPDGFDVDIEGRIEILRAVYGSPGRPENPVQAYKTIVDAFCATGISEATAGIGQSYS